MTSKIKSNTLATGLAVFSMFFGAGNIVFPLAIGQYAQGHTFYAMLGLLLTAVGVPFIGLLSMTLFDGNYQYFFNRIGKTPGFLVALFIMGLIGPFGALPRCIALSFATLNHYFPCLSLPLFSLFSCLIIYLCTYKQNKLIDILGYVLTPFLLLCLSIIVIKGLVSAPEMVAISNTKSDIFLFGLKEGYQTMDLLGSFFFSSVVLLCLKKNLAPTEHQNHKRLIILTLKAGCIGMFLLTLVYVGFSFVAAYHSAALSSYGKDVLLSVIAENFLGSFGGIVASAAVALACLTTAIALSAVFAEFFSEKVCLKKINYNASLIITLIVSFFMSTLNFTGIIAILAPILQICYPALIVLSVLNIAYKLCHFNPVKIPVLAVFLFSLLGYFFG